MSHLVSLRSGAETASAENASVDAALVARARHDPRAFGDLYERYVGPIFGYCHHRLGSREDAEDATSLIFAKAMASLPSHRGGSFRGWLFGIAHHVIADWYRGRQVAGSLDEADDVHDAAPSPERMAIVREDHDVLYAALAQLAPDQRRVVELRLAGLTSAEIGQALGKSAGAVDVLQHRAVRRLRQVLGAAREEERYGRG